VRLKYQLSTAGKNMSKTGARAELNRAAVGVGGGGKTTSGLFKQVEGSLWKKSPPGQESGYGEGEDGGIDNSSHR